MEFYLNEEEIINSYRYLHTIPEPEWQEFKTSEYIYNKLKEFGLSPVKCTKTGIYADITVNEAQEKILFRADIDALPMTEETNLDFRSKNDGYMHACGHDFHVSCLLYAAKILNENKKLLRTSVRVVFQPAEEGSGGALPMIEEGVLDGVTAAYAIHAEPMENVGVILYKNGGITASPDDFLIKIYGKGGHGAEPENCINPIITASEIIKKCYNLKKEKHHDDEYILSICTIHSGSFYNIIPEYAEIGGTVRTCDSKLRNRIKESINEIIENIASKNGCKYEFIYNEMYPPTVCSVQTNKIAVNAAKKTSGIEKITELDKGYFIGDDFAYFSERVPSSYVRFGTSDPIDEKYPLHSPMFRIDEKSLILGCNFLVNVALEYK